MRLAVIQQANNADIAANQARSEQLIRAAAAEGAELIMLQELHNSLYFCQSEDVANFDLAETIPGPSTYWLGQLAKELNVVLVGSLFEKRTTGLYHNTAVVLEKDGTLAGCYRKMHIPDDPGFYEKFYFTPGDAQWNQGGSGFQPINTSVGRLGLLVCWDQWYPEAARLMALAGAEILLYPTAIGWDTTDTKAEQQRQLDAWIIAQRAHGVSNGLPVVVANRVGFEPSPLADAPGGGVDFWGHSFICGPQGEMLAHAAHQEETALVADIDLKRSEDVRRIWPYLRDRRVDAYGELTKRFID